MTMPTEEQLVFLEQHQAAFDEAYGEPGEHRPVREYCDEYAYVDGLFENICSDLGLDPSAVTARAPLDGEVWEEADGCLLLRHNGRWRSFAGEVFDDSPNLARPLRLRFRQSGEDATGGAPLQYPQRSAFTDGRAPTD